MDDGQYAERSTLRFDSAVVVVDQSPLGMATHYLLRDAQGAPDDHVFLEVNRAFLVLTGLTRRRCLGRRGSAVLPAATARAWTEVLGRALDQRCRAELEYDLPSSTRRLRITAFPTGREAVGTIVEDITAAERTHGSYRAVASALEQAGQVVLVVDADGLVEYANQPFASLTGFDPQALVGHALGQLTTTVWERIQGRDQWSGETTWLGFGGTRWPLWCRAVAIRNAMGTVIRYVLTGAPVTSPGGPAPSTLAASGWPTFGETDPTRDGGLDDALFLAQQRDLHQRAAAEASARLHECLTPDHGVLPDAQRESARMADAGVSILVLDDDEAVRRLMVRVLEAAGYHVAAAASAAEALATTDEPGLVIADVSLGEANGVAVAEELMARWPRLRALCVSGYPLEALDGDSPMPQAIHFLAKPYSAIQLRTKVRDILEH